MDSLTVIFILNGVFFVSFYLLRNIYIPLGITLLTFFALLFVFKQKKISSMNVHINIPSPTFKGSHYVSTMVCLIIFFILEKLIGFNSALFVVFFIFAHLNKLNAKVSFFLALVLLVLTALLVAGGNARIAGDTAILTYCLLTIGVIWQIIELRSVKPTEEANLVPDEREIKIIAKKEVFQRRSSSYNYIFLKRTVIMISLLVFFGFIIMLFVKQIKPPVIKKTVVKQQIATPIITPIPKQIIHASLVILNATDTRGLAGSSAAILRRDGWQKEFDISTGNYMGNDSLSANILKYTKNLEGKVPLIERSLNIVVTPILLEQATQEAELTLILGK